jgi:ATP-dependent RNA helicase DDX21
MIEILNKNGVKSLFPIQYRTFNSIYEGKDLKGKDKTGSGKTLAFSLPVIERLRKDNILRSSKNPKFLIVLPTRY